MDPVIIGQMIGTVIEEKRGSELEHQLSRSGDAYADGLRGGITGAADNRGAFL